jgi:hypothetical protein
VCLRWQKSGASRLPAQLSRNSMRRRRYSPHPGPSEPRQTSKGRQRRELSSLLARHSRKRLGMRSSSTLDHGPQFRGESPTRPRTHRISTKNGLRQRFVLFAPQRPAGHRVALSPFGRRDGFRQVQGKWTVTAYDSTNLPAASRRRMTGCGAIALL